MIHETLENGDELEMKEESGVTNYKEVDLREWSWRNERQTERKKKGGGRKTVFGEGEWMDGRIHPPLPFQTSSLKKKKTEIFLRVHQ